MERSRLRPPECRGSPRGARRGCADGWEWAAGPAGRADEAVSGVWSVPGCDHRNVVARPGDLEGSVLMAVSGQQIVDYLMQFRGTPYAWGGNDLQNGIDCSGLIQQGMAHFGINVGRTTYTQIGEGK